MKTTHKHWFALTASTLGLTGLSLASGFGDEKYTYDASGNVLEKQIGDQVTRYDYTGNQLNGSTSDSTRKQYAYDSSGRLTSDSEAGKPTRNMVHQYLDKVTKVQNGDKTTEFFYNAEGQLVATNSAGTSETFAWDGLAMVNRGEELFVNEAHAVGGVPAIVGNKVAVSDMIGSSLSVGNEGFESTAFGEGLISGLYTGKPFIKGIDGFIFKYRIYSAGVSRWLTDDPTGFPDGANNHAYALNDPISNVDPLGLVTWSHTGPNDVQSLTAYLTPGGPTQNQAEQHQADRSGSCYIETMTRGRTYSASTDINVPDPGYIMVQGGNAYSSSAGYRSDQLTHETVHKDLMVKMVNKTHGAFETWSAGYTSTNEFGSAPKALSAYNSDVSGAISATISKFNANLYNNSAPNHPSPGGGPGPQNGSIVVNGTTYNNFPAVAINPNWGANAHAAIDQIQITIPAKMKGDCEK
jgi:RHS repeat-associated protein